MCERRHWWRCVPVPVLRKGRLTRSRFAVEGARRGQNVPGSRSASTEHEMEWSARGTDHERLCFPCRDHQHAVLYYLWQFCGKSNSLCGRRHPRSGRSLPIEGRKGPEEALVGCKELPHRSRFADDEHQHCLRACWRELSLTCPDGSR